MIAKASKKWNWRNGKWINRVRRHADRMIDAFRRQGTLAWRAFGGVSIQISTRRCSYLLSVSTPKLRSRACMRALLHQDNPANLN